MAATLIETSLSCCRGSMLQKQQNCLKRALHPTVILCLDSLSCISCKLTSNSSGTVQYPVVAVLTPVLTTPSLAAIWCQERPLCAQDYRPGTSRADVEAEQRRQRRLDGRGGAGDEDEEPGGVGRRPGRWESTVDPLTGQNADGSFSRTSARLRVCALMFRLLWALADPDLTRFLEGAGT